MTVNEVIQNARLDQLIDWWLGDPPEWSKSTNLFHQKVARALKNSGSEGIKFLKSQVTSDTLQRQAMVIRCLADRATYDSDVIGCLAEFFRNPHPGAKETALQGLICIEEYPLIRSEVESLLDHAEGSVSAEAMIYLSRAYPGEAVQILSSGLKSTDSFRRGKACVEAGRRNLLELKPEVARLLDDGEDYVSRSAEMALDQFRPVWQPDAALALSGIQLRTIRFPPDRSIGKLEIRAAGSCDEWLLFTEAVGTLAIPASMELGLEVSFLSDPKVFSLLEPDALSELSWYGNIQATDAAIAHIQHLTELRGLALWETRIGDEALRYIRHLKNLRWLDIGDTKITDAGLAYLAEMSRLEYLSLLNCEISDAGLVHLQRVSSLRQLDLMNTSVTDSGVDTLSKMPQLRNLRVFKTEITEKGYQSLRRTLPRCEVRYRHPHYSERKNHSDP